MTKIEAKFWSRSHVTNTIIYDYKLKSIRLKLLSHVNVGKSLGERKPCVGIVFVLYGKKEAMGKKSFQNF